MNKPYSVPTPENPTFVNDWSFFYEGSVTVILDGDSEEVIRAHYPMSLREVECFQDGYRRAYKIGHACGENAKAREIRSALGL